MNHITSTKSKILFAGIVITSLVSFGILHLTDQEATPEKKYTGRITLGEKKKKTPEERAMFAEERLRHEFNLQANPITGKIPLEEKNKERMLSIAEAKNEISKKTSRGSRAAGQDYISRGPTNLGGRTRSIVIDKADNTGQTIIAGGVSSGVFRTTDGGASWVKVSSNDQIHNVTAIAQDPRSGSENIWYYATGESLGNSASLSGAFYFGQGIWQSTDGGLNWTQMPGTASDQTLFDNRFDFVQNIKVHPTTGDLFAATVGNLYRYDIDTSTWISELEAPAGINTSNMSDVAITSNGRVFAAFSGSTNASVRGVWTSANGEGSWSRIADNGNPTSWQTESQTGRIVLSTTPANDNILYALYGNGGSSESGQIESDLWRYDNSTTTWTNFSAKLPDETGGSAGNDPFAIQGGYDLVVSTKPDDANFVLIGGTNAYKIADIDNDPSFIRIGGYGDVSTYPLWGEQGGQGGDNHHPDIHAFAFDPNNSAVMYSGTDGGIHRTDDLDATTVLWTNLNNNYQTYQYYHVAIDPGDGANRIIGGAQDNGTTGGGTDFGLPDNTTMSSVFGGDGVAVGISRDDACIPFFLGSQLGQIIRDCPVAADITPTGSSSQFVTYFYLDPDNNNALYYAGQTTLYRTTNSTTVASDSWDDMEAISSIPGGGTQEYIQSMATTRGAYTTQHMLFIGGDEGGLYRLRDPQNASSISSAEDITPPGMVRTFPNIVSGISTHPSNPDIVMAVYSSYGVESIWLTENATADTPTWIQVERNLEPFSIRSVAVTEFANGRNLYFVGTARGLYANDNPKNEDWVMQSPDQIGMAVVSSLAYRPSDTTLLIGTHGNGIFEADAATVLDSFPNEDEDNDGVKDGFDLCPGTPEGTTVDVDGCEVFSLPSNNFGLVINSETCRANNNGSVQITATESLNYTATLNGTNASTSQSFTDNVVFDQLVADSYELCITVDGQAGYEQCFNISVTEPDALTARASINGATKTVNLELAGSDLYHIELNGDNFSTSSQNVTLQLIENRINTLKVSTDKDCQGTFSQTFNLLQGILVFPNPVAQGPVYIQIDKAAAETANVTIYDITGATIFKRTVSDPTQRMTLEVNLDNAGSGTYFAVIEKGTEVTTRRFIKR